MHLDLTLYEGALCGGPGGAQAVVAPFILSLTPEDHALMLRWSSPPASTSEDHAPLAPRPPTPPTPPPPPPLLPPTRPASAPAAPVERAAPPRLCDDRLCDAAGAGAEGAGGAEGAEGAEGAPLSQQALLAQLGSIQHHLERRGEHIVVGTYCSRHMQVHMHMHMHVQNYRPARRCVTGAPPPTPLAASGAQCMLLTPRVVRAELW